MTRTGRTLLAAIVILIMVGDLFRDVGTTVHVLNVLVILCYVAILILDRRQ